jgi:LysM repeat protein
MKFLILLISLFVACAFGGCTSSQPKKEILTEIHAPIPADGKYTVVAGDTAVKIAFRFEISLADLISLNPNQDWAKLKIGQQVIVSK